MRRGEAKVMVLRSDLERWATAMPVLATLLDAAVPRGRSSEIAREHHAEMLAALQEKGGPCSS